MSWIRLSFIHTALVRKTIIRVFLKSKTKRQPVCAGTIINHQSSCCVCLLSCWLGGWVLRKRGRCCAPCSLLLAPCSRPNKRNFECKGSANKNGEDSKMESITTHIGSSGTDAELSSGGYALRHLRSWDAQDSFLGIISATRSRLHEDQRLKRKMFAEFIYGIVSDRFAGDVPHRVPTYRSNPYSLRVGYENRQTSTRLRPSESTSLRSRENSRERFSRHMTETRQHLRMVNSRIERKSWC